MEFSYDYFVECLIYGDQREFRFQNNIIIIRSTPKESIYTIERHGEIIYQKKYKTYQELLNDVKIDGKSIQEVWDKLELLN